METEKVLFFHQNEVYQCVEYYDYVDLSIIYEKPTYLLGNTYFGDTQYLNKFSNFWSPKSKKTLPGQNFCHQNFYEENKLKINFFSSKDKIVVKISEKDNKISFKFFYRYVSKQQGKPYFQIHTNCRYVTYNKKRNMFYFGSVTNYHKKRSCSKIVRSCKFNESPIEKIQSILLEGLNSNFVYPLSSEDFLTKNDFINFITKIFFKNVYPEYSKSSYVDYSIIFKKLYESRGIKLPDNWRAFTKTYLPSIKFFKKNKNKFIDTVMNQHSLKGDKVKKILHLVESFETSDTFSWSQGFFGEKFILSQDISLLIQIMECPFNFSVYKYPQFSKKEMDNIFKIFILVVNKKINTSTFVDHFNMINQLNGLEKIKWSSFDCDTFIEEHKIFSDKIGFYTKGFLQRFFHKTFENDLQKEINLLGSIYYPVLLKNTDDYNNESFVQSNCVKTYSDRPSCILLSIRKNSPTSHERISIQLDFKKVNQNFYLKRSQTLARFNQPIDEKFQEVCKIFDENLKKFLLKNTLVLPKVSLLVANKKFESEVVFNEEKLSFVWKCENFQNLLTYGIKTILNTTLDEVPIEYQPYGGEFFNINLENDF